MGVSEGVPAPRSHICSRWLRPAQGCGVCQVGSVGQQHLKEARVYEAELLQGMLKKGARLMRREHQQGVLTPSARAGQHVTRQEEWRKGSQTISRTSRAGHHGSG